MNDPDRLASQQELAELREYMVGAGEAPDHRRAEALITTMFGRTPKAEEVERYRRAL